MGWNEMTPLEKNAAYNNVAHVGAEVAAHATQRWLAVSTSLRAQRSGHLDLAYAARERTAWDFYPSSNSGAPCFVFIHGGYWQRGSKDIFASMAEGLLARGWSVALPGYTLAPAANLTQIVEELRLALDWYREHATQHGITGPLVLSGWSAGGHLAAALLDHPSVSAGVAISGVFDLEPLQESPHVNDLLQLSEHEVATLSPVRMAAVHKPLLFAFGTEELPHMIASSREFHALRNVVDLPGDLVPIIGCNHFTILDEMLDPGSLLVMKICELGERYVRG